MDGPDVSTDAFPDARERAGNLSQVVHATQATACPSRHVAPALLEACEANRRDLHYDPNARFAVLHFELQELVRVRQNTLTYTEADGEVGEVGRRRHHDDVGEAVIGQGDGNLGGNRGVPRNHSRTVEAKAGYDFGPMPQLTTLRR
jgi:hypothetical protein